MTNPNYFQRTITTPLLGLTVILQVGKMYSIELIACKLYIILLHLT